MRTFSQNRPIGQHLATGASGCVINGGLCTENINNVTKLYYDQQAFNRDTEVQEKLNNILIRLRIEVYEYLVYLDGL